MAMAKRSFEDLMAAESDVDRTRLAAATEGDIRQQARDDGDDPDEEPDGYVLVPHPRDLRLSLAMTQEAFAAFLRVPAGTIRNWDQGRTPPDPARAMAVLGWPDAGAEGNRYGDRRFG